MRVDWWDTACPDDAWMGEGEIRAYARRRRRGLPCSTVGFLLSRNRRRLILAATVAEATAGRAAAYSSLWIIPRGAVRRIRPL